MERDHPNWEHKTHGGPKNNMFWDTTVELVPEAIIVEAEPVKFPRRAGLEKARVVRRAQPDRDRHVTFESQGPAVSFL